VILSLAERFQVITIDFPGCGRSPRRAFSHDYYVENTKAALQVVRSLTKEPVWAIGNGGGGVVGLWMSILEPAMVQGVVADSCVEFLDMEDVRKDLMAHQNPSHEMVSFWREMNGDDWHTVISNLDRVIAEMTEPKTSLFNWRLEEVSGPVLLTGSRKDHLLSNLGRRLLEEVEQLPHPHDGRPIDETSLLQRRRQLRLGRLDRLGGDGPEHGRADVVQQVDGPLGERVPLLPPALPADVGFVILGVQPQTVQHHPGSRQYLYAYPVPRQPADRMLRHANPPARSAARRST